MCSTRRSSLTRTLIAAMNEVRAHGDALEAIVAKKYWPVPTYQDMLFY